MASRDVIVMIKWNHQKISNYLLDEKFTQLYLMKIGPVFLEHVGLVSKTCWYWRINQSLSNACEGSASCNIVYADCAALQVWRKKWLTTCDYREKTWCFTTCRRLPGPPATSSVERAKAKHRCVLSPVHTGDKVDRIGDKVDRVGDNVNRYKLSSSSCCRFVAKTTGNKVDRIGDSRLSCRFVASFGNSRLCRQCVPGFSWTVHEYTQQ